MREASRRAQADPGRRPMPFGHLGDGNIHFNVAQPVDADKAAFLARWHDVNTVVFEVVLKFGGSISAEHGIGILKRDLLPGVKDPVAMEMMRALKRTLDPNGILNPGKGAVSELAIAPDHRRRRRGGRRAVAALRPHAAVERSGRRHRVRAARRQRHDPGRPARARSSPPRWSATTAIAAGSTTWRSIPTSRAGFRPRHHGGGGRLAARAGHREGAADGAAGKQEVRAFYDKLGYGDAGARRLRQVAGRPPADAVDRRRVSAKRVTRPAEVGRRPRSPCPSSRFFSFDALWRARCRLTLLPRSKARQIGVSFAGD